MDIGIDKNNPGCSGYDCDTTFCTNNEYARDIVEALSILHKGLSAVENNHDSLRYNAHTGKYLHVKEWSYTDLAYMKNHLYS